MLEKLSEGDMPVEPTLSNFLINMMLTPRAISIQINAYDILAQGQKIGLGFSQFLGLSLNESLALVQLFFSLPRTRKLARCN